MMHPRKEKDTHTHTHPFPYCIRRGHFALFGAEMGEKAGVVGNTGSLG